MSAPDSGATGHPRPVVAHSPVVVLRFRPSERQMHWAIAIPFMVCYATAVVLIGVYNPDPQRPFRAVVSWTHRASGVCLGLGPLWMLVRHWADVALFRRNVREAWRWTVDDVKWLLLMAPATVSSRVRLPEQGKFNAAEKINFMLLTATYPLYLVSGVLIWSHQFAFPAWLLHFSLAAIATPLVFGHIFMATVNPDTRVGLSGMVTGFVERNWARHHYARWYREQVAEERRLEAAAIVEETPAEVVAWPPSRPAWPSVATPEAGGDAA
jgi:formate dehydrogenase gamma subunit